MKKAKPTAGPHDGAARPPGRSIIVARTSATGRNVEKAEIYCPKCEWRPQSEDRWMCVPSCGTVWNTFWTRAVCPGCGVKWPATECFGCGGYSPHEAWYHYPEPESEQASHSRSAETDAA